ncbi:MAG: sigma-70 family RNA polymerase sigma factor, partial [Planctomycetota bacterium]
MSDSELLADYAAGGERASQAFAEIVRRHADMVYSTCLRIVGDRHLAEDATQAVFLVLAGKAGSVPRRGTLAGWLYTTARHAALDARKRAARRVRHEREAAVMRSAADESPDWSRIAPHLDVALAALPAGQRDAVVLHYLEGKTQVEVASELRCDQSTVSKRIRGAMERLRGALARRGVDVSAAVLGSALAANALSTAPAGVVAAAQAAFLGGAHGSALAASIAEGTTKAMAWAKVKMAGAVLLASTVAAAGGGLAAQRLLAAEAPALPETLKSAPPNTWVKVLEAKSGGRDQPVFVYASKLGRFVAAAGMQHYGGVKPRHYDTEELDLEKLMWFNAYPPGTEKGRPESGPVGKEYAEQRAKHGYNGRRLFYKDGEHLRLGAGGQWHNGKTYGEFCYVPEKGEAGTVYAYMHKKVTAAYDVAARTWKDLKAEPRTKARIWGSMCYDPVNKEVLHVGGGSGSAELGTWAYSVEKNQWRELELGSEALKELWSRAKVLRWSAKVLLGRCASRHQQAETDEEAKVDLPAEAAGLAAEGGKLVGEVKSAQVDANEKAGAKTAGERLAKAVAAIKAVGPKLSGTITPALIAEVRAAREIFEKAVDALSPQPPGRARSPIAFDAENGKVVVFGGDGLDRALSDTWVYDAATRKWEQRFPKVCPAPRAGHLLGWLPKSKRIVVAGGYSRVPLAQDIWSYDVAGNEWKLLKEVPLGGGRKPASPGCPAVNPRTYLTGAVGPGDTLVCFSGNTVWACRADPSRPDAGSAAKGVKPGTYVWNRITPEIWEKAAPTERGAGTKFIEGL